MPGKSTAGMAGTRSEWSSVCLQRQEATPLKGQRDSSDAAVLTCARSTTAAARPTYSLNTCSMTRESRHKTGATVLVSPTVVSGEAPHAADTRTHSTRRYRRQRQLKCMGGCAGVSMAR